MMVDLGPAFLAEFHPDAHDERCLAWRRLGEMTFLVPDSERITALVTCPRCRFQHYAHITDRYVADANTGYREVEGQAFPMGRAWCVERECQQCGKVWSQYENINRRKAS